MVESLAGPQLSDFAHRGLPDGRDPADRIKAAGATILLYATLLAVALRGFVVIAPHQLLAAPRAAIVRLLPASPTPRLMMRDFNVHLIKPRLENAPLPQVVIAPAPTEAPKAALPVTAARNTAMAGGSATGNSDGGVSGIGTGGNGTGLAACIDEAYLQAILHHVARWYEYPAAERRLRVTGVVYMHFVIDKRGHYQKLTMLKSSGDKWLDQAAMLTMQRAEPLPQIPERFHTDQLDGVLPVIYQGTAPLVAEQLGHGAGGC